MLAVRLAADLGTEVLEQSFGVIASCFALNDDRLARRKETDLRGCGERAMTLRRQHVEEVDVRRIRSRRPSSRSRSRRSVSSDT